MILRPPRAPSFSITYVLFRSNIITHLAYDVITPRSRRLGVVNSSNILDVRSY